MIDRQWIDALKGACTALASLQKRGSGPLMGHGDSPAHCPGLSGPALSRVDFLNILAPRQVEEAPFTLSGQTKTADLRTASALLESET